jgi:hypothetical protein
VLLEANENPYRVLYVRKIGCCENGTFSRQGGLIKKLFVVKTARFCDKVFFVIRPLDGC